ncbi:right-handed parallel beta-helix repeat-containing protein [Cohnella lupini]|uniref:Parallel beta helix pectate lyase-like protein n=1 Tax=Cohnella lupini TaxID=1294267 RepID=A0A3D9IEX8_9BACL|nr:right-handed parallel beta-helix repeat-containing protein [Cohnella lupini]RED60344.1 parallel beta helix pectate lyase-like protein [Cohnella lupini]
MQTTENADSLAYVHLRLTDFGARPDSGEDATIPMQLALEAASRSESPVVLDCPMGRYDFYPANATRKVYYISNTASEEENADVTKTIALYLQGQKNLTLEGKGSSFIVHGKQTMMVLDDCERIELRNFNFDYARPTMAEMTVELSGAGFLEARVHPDSRYEITDGKLYWIGDGWRFGHGPMQVYDPVTNTTHRVDNWVAKAEKAETPEPGKLRFSGKGIPALMAGTVLQMRDGLRDQVGTFATGCRDIGWSNVGMHYMHGLGIICQFSENLLFDKMNLAPRDDSGRTAAAFADFIHLSGCRGKVKIANSRFIGGHDDPINVHGTHLLVVGQPSSNELLVRFAHPQTYGFEAFFPGDTIEFVRGRTLGGYASNRIVAAEAVNRREIRLILEREAPLEWHPGDVIENITWTPEVEISGNYFARIPTRGILVTTRRKVVIENNRFDRMTMSAILIADDAESWFESGRVQDVTIRGNEFMECGGTEHAVIRIEPENSIISDAYPVHSNIRIERNRFVMNDSSSALHAKSTEQLLFTDNEIELQKSLADISDSHDELIGLAACRDVKIEGNSVIGGTEILSVRIGKMIRETLFCFPENKIKVMEDETSNG